MIMYFSAAGNTKYCAESLGIFAPVYAWDFPRAVYEFLESFTKPNVTM